MRRLSKTFSNRCGRICKNASEINEINPTEKAAANLLRRRIKSSLNLWFQNNFDDRSYKKPLIKNSPRFVTRSRLTKNIKNFGTKFVKTFIVRIEIRLRGGFGFAET